MEVSQHFSSHPFISLNNVFLVPEQVEFYILLIMDLYMVFCHDNDFIYHIQILSQNIAGGIGEMARKLTSDIKNF